MSFPSAASVAALIATDITPSAGPKGYNYPAALAANTASMTPLVQRILDAVAAGTIAVPAAGLKDAGGGNCTGAAVGTIS